MTNRKKSRLPSDVPGLNDRLWQLTNEHGGLTAFAECIGKDTKTVGKWLYDDVVPGGKMLAAIATACSVSLDWLLLGIGPKEVRVSEGIDSLPDALARYVANAVSQAMGEELGLVGDGHRLLQQIAERATADFRAATEQLRHQRQLRGPLLHVHTLLDSLHDVLPSLAIGAPDSFVKGAQHEVRDECALLLERLGEISFAPPAVWFGPDSTEATVVLTSDPYDLRVPQLPAHLRRLAKQQEEMRREAPGENSVNSLSPAKGKKVSRRKA